MEQFLAFVAVLLALVPVIAFGSPLIAFIVDTLKRIGLPDGFAPLASGLLNLALYAVVFFVGPEHEGEVKNVVDGLLLIAPVVLALFTGVIATVKAHQKLAAAGVGYNHSGPKLRPVG